MTTMDRRPVMYWYPDDGPWSAEATRRFQQQGSSQLVMVAAGGWIPKDLTFLHDLPGLRSLRYTGRTKDDLAAFGIAALEDLSLITGSKVAVPDVVQPHLTRLVLTDRPGIAVRSRWPNLTRLRIGRWIGTDLSMLDQASTLTEVYLEARRQKGNLEGIEGCEALESLTLVDYPLNGTEPLRGLDSLKSVELFAAKPAVPHDPLDMAAITSPILVKLWISNASALLNLASLLDHRWLRDLRLTGCQLSEADLRLLERFPKRVSVQLIKG